jgi:double-stranded uracil-DNA glycosylase
MKLDLVAARERTLPDVLPPEGARLDVLFCGINPGLYSAATGWHFARPGNRFWPALHASGFTPRLLAPSEQQEITRHGLGLTNVAPRATAQAAELSAGELRAGAARLVGLAERRRPRFVAIAGVTAYRTAFARPKATMGPQADRIGPATVWILPSPSGLNASWTLPRLTEAFSDLRAAVAQERQRLAARYRPVPDQLTVSGATSGAPTSTWRFSCDPRATSRGLPVNTCPFTITVTFPRAGPAWPGPRG